MGVDGVQNGDAPRFLVDGVEDGRTPEVRDFEAHCDGDVRPADTSRTRRLMRCLDRDCNPTPIWVT